MNEELSGAPHPELNRPESGPAWAEAPQLPVRREPAADPFGSDFSVEIPDEVLAGTDGFNSERKHQEWMYHLRTALESTEQGKRFAWVPQAIEAFLRRHQGMEGYVARFESLQVSPRLQVVTLRAGGRSVDLRLDELEPYSVELRLAALGAPEPIGIAEYSEGMAAAIEELSPAARYKWDLITRAAQYEAEHPDEVVRVRGVRPLGSDPFIPDEGVGVFFLDGPGGDGWSAVKNVQGDVPLLLREREWQRVSRELSASYFSERMSELTNVLHWINRLAHWGTKVGDVSLPKWAERLHLGILRRLSPEHHRVLLVQLEAIQKKFNEHRFKYHSLPDAVDNYIFRQKGRYTHEYPFEVTNLPPEIVDQMREARDEIMALMNEVVTFINQYAAQFMKMLPDESSLGDDPNIIGKGQLGVVRAVLDGRTKLEDRIPVLSIEDRPHEEDRPVEK